jgi:alanine dehydrogenase
MLLKVKSIGFPRMIDEKGEKRDFLPEVFSLFNKYHDVDIYLEGSYGADMGYSAEDYLKENPSLIFTSHEEVYSKDMVIVLKAPSVKDIMSMNRGSYLFSMLHYETRPIRNELLKKQGIKTLSMDSIVDDDNARLFVNYYGTSRSGTKIAFYELQKKLKDHDAFKNKPINTTIIGMGGVGLNSSKAFEEFSDLEFLQSEKPGVIVKMLPRSITKNIDILEDMLKETDILVDASRRSDVSKPIISNKLISNLPEHSVILDLAADPYNVEVFPINTKGIEGIPTGNLEKYVIEPDDELYDTIPTQVNSTHRRTVVSCNAWPGVDPVDCMKIYGSQLVNYLKVILSKNEMQLSVDSDNHYERAIYRSTMEHFCNTQ